MAFFPNFIKKRYQLQKQTETRAPFPEDQIPEYKEILMARYTDNNIWEPYLFLRDPQLHDEIAEEALYKICTNSLLRNTLMWICKHTLFSMITDTYLTVGIHVRIGTSMLNKLENQGWISKDLNIYYHDNFVANLAALSCEMSMEELPF